MAVLRRAESADSFKAFPFTVIGVGAVVASLQKVEAVGDGREGVVRVTVAVAVLVIAGEIGEKDADIQIFTGRN